MARIRQLKPEFWTDDKIAQLSRDARLLFLGLWTEADDDGRLVDSAKLIAGSLFPFDDDVTPKKLTVWLDEIIRAGLVRRYTKGSGSYLYVVNFKRHQKIAHPRRSSLPPPEGGPSGDDDPPEDREPDAREAPADRARDLGVKGSRGRGVEGVGVVNNSSSNHQVVALHTGKIEEETIQNQNQPQREPSAIDIIAARQLQERIAKKHLGSVGDQIAWLASARARASAEHGATVARLAGEGLNPIEVADRIMPVPGSQWPQWAPPEDPAEPVEQSPDRLAEARAAMAVPRSVGA